MAGKRITEEQKIQINELYAQIGVKSQVAKIMGISASSVSKYIVENYVPLAKRTPIKRFEKEPPLINLADIEKEDFFFNLTHLSNEEKEDMKEFWEGAMI